MKLKIKKGATVQVITGADKGKKGTVLAVNTEKMTVTVQGVKVETHYSKQDGLQKKEGAIAYSNVKLLEAASKEKKATKKAKTKNA